MRRVRLIHWNAAEAKERAARLRAAGYAVVYEPLTPAALRKLREDPPAAVVIDLIRIPTQGRDVGLAIRHYKSTRRVPLVFVEGDPEKVTRIKALLPDAVYTTWSRIRGALKGAIAHPPAHPIAPRSLLAGYAGTPLATKLGIKAHSMVVLVDAPPGFEKTLRPWPDGATVRRQPTDRRDLTVWFARSRKDLQRRIDRMVPHADRGGLWIAWPKQASLMAGDLVERVVREVGLAAGLVDFKVCAIDATWAGLRFSRRRRPDSST